MKKIAISFVCFCLFSALAWGDESPRDFQKYWPTWRGPNATGTTKINRSSLHLTRKQVKNAGRLPGMKLRHGRPPSSSITPVRLRLSPMQAAIHVGMT